MNKIYYTAIGSAVFLGLTLMLGATQPALASGSETMAKSNPYVERADAAADIRQALTEAAAEKKIVLLVFGANWCGDCKILDAMMKNGTVSKMVTHDFKVVKVNVGRFDKNVSIAEKYGIPLKKGIPAIAILSPENTVLFATKAGELADARKMGDTGIYTFFKKIAGDAKAK